MKAVLIALLTTWPILPIRIRQWPISFSQKRKAETLKYIQTHYDSNAKSIKIDPSIIVVHHTGINTLKGSWATFNRETINSMRKKVSKAGSVNVSIHFLVSRDGHIFQLMPLNLMARHVIGLNRKSIGIENVGSDKRPLTRAQLNANARLIRYLKKRKPKLKYLIGHHEYRDFENSMFFEEKDSKYRTIKSDPGKNFMRQIRYRVKDLKFKAIP